MPNINAHKPGSFCWVELGTTDQDAAKKFYGSLFGWTPNDNPMGSDGVYTIFKLQDRDAAAAYTLRAEDRARGVPPHWMIYIAIENADDAAGRVNQLGGKIIAPPFDVMDAGRMAVVQDPTGAIFSLWQAKKSSGIGIAEVPGTLCWADLSTRDQGRARRFYSDLFGWKMNDDTDDDPPSGYVHIQNGDDFIGGILPPAYVNPHAPPHWMPYFLVANCDNSAAQGKRLGAKIYMEPKTLENAGRFAVLADPQGAAFAIFQVIPKK
jgi:uncharacterized protein